MLACVTFYWYKIPWERDLHIAINAFLLFFYLSVKELYFFLIFPSYSEFPILFRSIDINLVVPRLLDGEEWRFFLGVRSRNRKMRFQGLPNIDVTHYKSGVAGFNRR